GKVLLYNGKVERYKASVGQKVYLENRQNSRKNYRCLENVGFLRYVEKKVITAGWSIDACVGYAKKNHQFEENEMVCTKTLYNYIDSGLLSITRICSADCYTVPIAEVLCGIEKLTNPATNPPKNKRLRKRIKSPSYG
ncbi:MAG: hypothetical protein PUB20_03535, partial [Clostridia bacterium]|nr:hypothetical protein [Clostridia bacterium]